LNAALLAAMRLDDLDLEGMRAGLSPHGELKADLDMRAGRAKSVSAMRANSPKRSGSN